MTTSLNFLYETIGISKQAVSQYEKRQKEFDKKMEHLIVDADILKKRTSWMWCRKDVLYIESRIYRQR